MRPRVQLELLLEVGEYEALVAAARADAQTATAQTAEGTGDASSGGVAQFAAQLLVTGLKHWVVYDAPSVDAAQMVARCLERGHEQRTLARALARHAGGEGGQRG